MNFAPMEKELAFPEGFVVPGPSGHVLGNVGINEKGAAGLEVDIGITDIGLAFAEGFYFGAVQHQSRFQLLKNMVMIRSGAVLGNDLLTRRLGVLALPGQFVWLSHNLSFYLMLRPKTEKREKGFAQCPRPPACPGPIENNSTTSSQGRFQVLLRRVEPVTTKLPRNPAVCRPSGTCASFWRAGLTSGARLAL
jgi:hypothetical protein